MTTKNAKKTATKSTKAAKSPGVIAPLTGTFLAAQKRADAKVARMEKTHPNTSELQEARLAATIVAPLKTPARRIEIVDVVEAANVATIEKLDANHAEVQKALAEMKAANAKTAKAAAAATVWVDDHAAELAAAAAEKAVAAVKADDALATAAERAEGSKLLGELRKNFKRKDLEPALGISHFEYWNVQSQNAKATSAAVAKIKAFASKNGLASGAASGAAHLQAAVATIATAARRGDKVSTGVLKLTKKTASAYAKLLGVSAADLEAAGQLTFIW